MIVSLKEAQGVKGHPKKDLIHPSSAEAHSLLTGPTVTFTCSLLARSFSITGSRVANMKAW